MIKLKCVKTGSLGNLYILDYNGKKLVIELGVDYNTFLLNIENMIDLQGVIVSHYHDDHFNKSLYDKIKNCGFDILTNDNTNIGKPYKLGEFIVSPLPCKHNIDCSAWAIKVENEVILFATDTAIIPRVKTHINHFIVEVNFIEQIRQEMVVKGIDLSHINIVSKNHQSLESCVDYFNKLDYKPKNIITIHKSNSGLFDSTITINALKKYATNVQVAKNGEEYIL